MTSFFETIGELRKGFTLSELNDKLTEVVAAVRKAGKPGKLTLTLTVKPASRGETEVLMIEDAITTKLPQLDRGTTVFYATEENSLQREDPRQSKLDLRVVEMDKKPLKEVSIGG